MDHSQRTRGVLVTSLLVAAGMSSTAWAGEIFSFYKITNNGNPNVGSQLSVAVDDAGDGTVNFTFYNAVGTASSITEVYFDDGTLLHIASMSWTTGVAFSDITSNGNINLPGGNDADPDFNATQGFAVDADPPKSQNGVDAASEWLTINFTLQGGQTYNDTLLALADGSLRIGLHVQAIGDSGGSDSYVNTAIIPLPGGAAMAGFGLLLLAGGTNGRRRRD